MNRKMRSKLNNRVARALREHRPVDRNKWFGPHASDCPCCHLPVDMHRETSFTDSDGEKVEVLLRPAKDSLN